MANLSRSQEYDFRGHRAFSRYCTSIMDSRPGANEALLSIFQLGTLRRAVLDVKLFKRFQQLISSKQVLKNIPPEEIDYLAGD